MSRKRACPEPQDHLIDEVRAVRKALCEEFENDMDRLIDYLRGLERCRPDRVGEGASPSPARRRRKPGSA